MSAARVAVTGASGFIGRHVLAALASSGARIVAVTREAARLAGPPAGTKVVEMSLDDADAGSYARLGRPDVLIHLAWDGLPNYRSPHHLTTELPRQCAFLERLIESGLPALLVTGTCFEYGMQSGCLAESLPARPDNPYGEAKDRLRRQLESLRAARHFGLTWARLFYMYGEGQGAGSLYSQLEAAVERGDRVFDMSGGAQLRDFLPVTEIARLLTTLALTRPDAGIVNVCSGRPISVRELVEGWLAERGWSIELNPGHYPYPDYEPMEFWGDRSKLDRLLRGDA